MTSNIVAIIIAIIGSGVLNTVINRMFVRIDNKRGIRKALRLMIKDRLRELCEKYIARDWIYEDELEELMELHESYQTDLGGNGYLDEFMRRVKQLEIKFANE